MRGTFGWPAWGARQPFFLLQTIEHVFPGNANVLDPGGWFPGGLRVATLVVSPSEPSAATSGESRSGALASEVRSARQRGISGVELSSHERILHHCRNVTDVLELFRGYRRRALLPCVRKNSAVAAWRRLLRVFWHAAEAHARLDGSRTAVSFALLEAASRQFRARLGGRAPTFSGPLFAVERRLSYAPGSGCPRRISAGARRYAQGRPEETASAA